MTLKVEFTLAAEEDLRAIHRWIPDADVAIAYVKRIRERCDRLVDFPNRGTQRDDILPGLRTVPFERTAIVAYMIDVQILRVLHHGRDLVRAFPR